MKESKTENRMGETSSSFSICFLTSEPCPWNPLNPISDPEPVFRVT